MNNLISFEGNQIEIFEHEGRILFNPKDVARCLDLSESGLRNYLAEMNDKQAILVKNSDVLNRDIRKLNNAGEKFITESGVYKLIFRSRKESAERFQDWVTDEVLPEIRENGSYGAPTINKRDQLVLTIFDGGVSAVESARELIRIETEGIKKGENQQIKVSDLSKSLGISTIMLNDYLVENEYGTYKKANESKVFVPSEKFIEEIANEGHALTRVVNGNQRPTYKKSSIDHFLINHLENIREFAQIVVVEDIVEVPKEDLVIFADTKEQITIDKDKQNFITKRLQYLSKTKFNGEYAQTYQTYYNALKEFHAIDLMSRRPLGDKTSLVSFIYESEIELTIERLFNACKGEYLFFREDIKNLGISVERLDKTFNY